MWDGSANIDTEQADTFGAWSIRIYCWFHSKDHFCDKIMFQFQVSAFMFNFLEFVKNNFLNHVPHRLRITLGIILKCHTFTRFLNLQCILNPFWYSEPLHLSEICPWIISTLLRAHFSKNYWLASQNIFPLKQSPNHIQLDPKYLLYVKVIFNRGLAIEFKRLNSTISLTKFWIYFYYHISIVIFPWFFRPEERWSHQ